MPGNTSSKSSKTKSKSQNGQSTQNVNNGGHVANPSANQGVNQGGWTDVNHTSFVQGQIIPQGSNMYPPPYMTQHQNPSQGQAFVPGNMQNAGCVTFPGQGQGCQQASQTQQSNVQYDQSGSLYAPQQNMSMTNNSVDNGTIITLLQQLNGNFMGRLSNIEASVSKLSSIECEIGLVRSDLSKLQLDNASMSQRMTEVERSCQMISNMYDDATVSNSELREDVSRLRSEHDLLNSKVDDNIAKFNARCNLLKDELLEVKARSMQTNLVFYGLAEAPKGDNENCEHKLRDFLSNELDFDDPDTVNNIVFDRVHRLGRPRRDQDAYPRPIVARFERYKDRGLIREAGKNLNDKNNGYNIREQFPPEIELRRKQLYPVMRQYLRDRNNRVVLVRDKLYINGELYKPPNTSETESQNRKQYSAESIKPSARNRRTVRGVRLAERPSIETRNRFGQLRMDNDEPQVLMGSSQVKHSVVGKRPASSPAHDETETKKYVGQGVGFGTVSEHVENDPLFPLMELDASVQHATDRKSDDAQMQPSEIDKVLSPISSEPVHGPLTVQAEVHNENNDSRVSDKNDSVVIEISEGSAEGSK